MRAYLDDDKEYRKTPSDFGIRWYTVKEAQDYCVDKGVPLYISS